MLWTPGCGGKARIAGDRHFGGGDVEDILCYKQNDLNRLKQVQ